MRHEASVREAGDGRETGGGGMHTQPGDAATETDVEAGPPDTAPPRILSISVAAAPNVPQAGSVEVQLDEPASIEVILEAAGGHNVSGLGSPTPASWHQFPLLGMRPDRTYSVVVRATDASGNAVVDDTHVFTTPPLPSDFPPIEVVSLDPSRVSPGVTLFNVFRFNPGLDTAWGYFIALDEEAQVVWYMRTPHRALDIKRFTNGNFVYNHSNQFIVEMDVLGNTIQQWAADNFLAPGEVPPNAVTVDADTFHHEMTEMPNGNIVVLSTEAREISDSPDSGADYCPNYPEPLRVVGDVIVEFAPATGAIIKRVSTFDLMDPCRRLDRGFELQGLGFYYPSHEWTHSNSVIYDETRDLYIVSVRHADWILAIRRSDLTAAWILGDEGAPGDYAGVPAFTLEGFPSSEYGSSPDYFYWQHAPMLTSTGTLLLFDNGNDRPGSDLEGNDNLPFSRAVEYALDFNTMTARQVWEFKDVWKTEGTQDIFFYSTSVSDADELPNGNVLVTEGGLNDPIYGAASFLEIVKWARIVEVTHDAPPQVVLDVRIRDDSAPPNDGGIGYSVYRGERLPSLLP